MNIEHLVNQQSSIWKIASYILCGIITLVCAFFIGYNAQWLFGDDAIVMSFTGWGDFFPMSHTISPEAGRFFPFAYLMYNILPIFFHNQISATIIYGYHAILFTLFAGMSFYLSQKILRNQYPIWRYCTALLITIFLIGRHYSDFVNCYSTCWFSAVLNAATILFAYLFYEKKGWWCGLIAFIILVWMTYCAEVSFVVPLVWGVCALPLWKKSTLQERIFHIMLIVNAVIFLLIYFFAIYLNTISAYDGAHGSNVTFLGNAVHILIAQKFLWVVIALFIIRIWDIIKNKSEYSIYDVLILTAAGYCLACFILRLNWVLYYNRSIVIAIPAILYYGDKYLRPYILCFLIGVFAIWYGIKIPKTIKTNRESRSSTIEFVNTIVDTQKESRLPLYLYSMGENDSSFDGEMVRWLYDSFETYYGYVIGERDLTLPRVDDYCGEGIYLTIKYNDNIVPNSNKVISQYCDSISYNKMRDMNVWISK